MGSRWYTSNRPPRSHHYILEFASPLAFWHRINRCQISVANRWQLASRRRLLQIVFRHVFFKGSKGFTKASTAIPFSSQTCNRRRCEASWHLLAIVTAHRSLLRRETRVGVTFGECLMWVPTTWRPEVWNLLPTSWIFKSEQSSRHQSVRAFLFLWNSSALVRKSFNWNFAH